MYFMVEWAQGAEGPNPVVGAPQFDGETLIIDGNRYSESQWQTITVMSEAPSGEAKPKPKRSGLYTIETTRDG